jgi:hypothetical protein
MLMTLLVLYILGSSGTFPLVVELDHAKTLIKADVAEGPHRTELLDVIDKAEHAAKDALEKRKKTTKELLALEDSYHAQAGEMQALLQQERAEIASYQEEMIRYRFELKGKMSREEWAKVFPAAR